MKKISPPKTNLPVDDVQNGIYFDNNPLPMWVYDLETYRFMAVNHAAQKNYGYSRAEFLAMRLADIRPQEEVERLLKDLQQDRPSLQDSGTWRHRRKDGSVMDVEIHSHTLEYEGRKAALVIAMNITKRKQAEDALRESENRFHRLAENAPDLIYRYEFAPERGFTYVSPAASAITGYSPEEHYADPDLGFKLVHPDDRPLLEAAARGETTPGQPLVLRWVRKDGSILWTEQRNKPVLNEAGEMVALEGIARDITERKQAEEQIRASED
ncbi:MAG: PAS domain-containing protein, partial [Chloroflexota bacterium]